MFLCRFFSHFGNKSLLFLNSPCSYSIEQSTYIWTPLMWIKFTCAILPISSISRLTIAHMWSKGVGAVCILVTGMVSFTLVNFYKLTDRKEGIKLCKTCRAEASTVLNGVSHGCLQPFAGFWSRTRDCRTWRKLVVYVKSYSFLTFSLRQAGKQKKQNKRNRKYTNERAKKTIHTLNKL